jgi:hypothetical protein
MPSLSIFVSERTMRLLEGHARHRGRPVHDLASAAVEEAALRAGCPEMAEGCKNANPNLCTVPDCPMKV